MPGLASRALRCVLVLETLASVTLEKRSSSDNFLGLAYALASLSLSLSLSGVAIAGRLQEKPVMTFVYKA